jgi:hypothetical protein
MEKSLADAHWVDPKGTSVSVMGGGSDVPGDSGADFRGFPWIGELAPPILPWVLCNEPSALNLSCDHGK